MLQVRQRGVAGAKVVQGKANTHLAAGANHLGHVFKVCQCAAFQHLQLQVASRYARVVGQLALQAGDKLGVLQVNGIDVDADGQRQACGFPGFDLRHRGVQHPFTDVDGHRMVGHGRQEGTRRQQAALGVQPADQGLHAHDIARAHVDLGLVVQQEFALVQRLTDARHAFVVATQAAVLFDVEDVIPVLAGQFGLVHRLVGLAQQLVGLDTIGLRVKRHAQAGRHPQHMAAGVKGLARGGQQPGQQRCGGCGIGQVAQDGDELVAAHARQRVALAQGTLHVA